MRREEATRRKMAGAEESAAFGALAPGRLDRLALAVTTRLSDNWLGLRLAILLRRIVTTRLPYLGGAPDVERRGVRLRLHPRDNGCEKNLLFTPRMYEPVELAELAADLIIEDSRASWTIDLMAMLLARGYAVAARSKQNFILRRAGSVASASVAADDATALPRSAARVEVISAKP